MQAPVSGVSAMTLTAADLQRLGYTVKDGVAVRTALSIKGKLVPSERSVYRSKWEADRAEMLTMEKVVHLIRDWRYEGIRLRLADGAWYKPDFLVWHNDGLLELQEVKGHWREAARVRWKVAIAQYPMFGFSLWTKAKGQWSRVELYHPTGTPR
jgi:hypothetical protein